MDKAQEKIGGKLPKDPTNTRRCFVSKEELHAFDTGYFTAQQDMLRVNYHKLEGKPPLLSEEDSPYKTRKYPKVFAEGAQAQRDSDWEWFGGER